MIYHRAFSQLRIIGLSVGKLNNESGQVTNTIIVVKMPCKLLYIIQVEGCGKNKVMYVAINTERC